MKKIFAVLIVTLVLLTFFTIDIIQVSAEAEAGNIGECSWTLDGTVLTVSGKGKMADFDAPWGKNITEVIVEEGVTHIGANAFYDCKSLTTVKLPESLKSIGEKAFYWCESLKEISLPNGLETIGDSSFCNCDSIEEITIPNSVVSIGDRAFSDCVSLKKLIISDSVEHIGGEAFGWCESLEIICFGKGIKTIASGAFIGCTNLSQVHLSDVAAWCAVTEVLWGEDVGETAWNFNPFFQGADLYVNGELVTELAIPEGVKRIEKSIFRGCLSINSLILPNSLEFIGESAFEECDALESITLGNGLKTVEKDAFFGIYNLKKVNITSLNDWFMINFSEGLANPLSVGPDVRLILDGEPIEKLVIPEGIGRIRNGAFNGYEALTEVTFPKSLLHIEDIAFFSCPNLKKIVFSEGLTSIGQSAFSNCNSLTEVALPDTLTEIGAYSFAYCNSLSEITIPASVEQVGYDAFLGCASLDHIYINSPKAAESISENWFSYSFEVKDGSIYVKEDIDSVSSYLTVNFPCRLQGIEHNGNTYSVYAGEHTRYENGCDDSCECGYIRDNAHRFDGNWINTAESHMKICSDCGESSGEMPHYYKSVHTTNCLACGYAREVVHDYSEKWMHNKQGHWHVCTVCNKQSETERHDYDGIMDPTCNFCGYTRQLPKVYTDVITEADTDAPEPAEKHDFDSTVFLIIIIAAGGAVIGVSAFIEKRNRKKNAPKDGK